MEPMKKNYHHSLREHQYNEIFGKTLEIIDIKVTISKVTTKASNVILS